MTHSSHVTTPLGLLLAFSLGGCLSLEPLASYSSGGPALQEPPTFGEPGPAQSEPAVTPAEPDAQMPVSEGVPGDGNIALEPTMLPQDGQPQGVQPQGVQPEAMQPDPPASEPEATPSCAGPGEFTSADGQTCYLAATQTAAWTDAFAACQTWGGGLVIIESREEDELIAQHITATSWTGASDLVQEGRMLWIGGAPVVFANWAMGQPDDFQGREDCVVKIMPAGSWNDLPCRNLNAYVCERREN